MRALLLLALALSLILFANPWLRADDDDGGSIFDEPGTYPIFCVFHLRMRGTVVVR